MCIRENVLIEPKHIGRHIFFQNIFFLADKSKKNFPSLFWKDNCSTNWKRNTQTKFTKTRTHTEDFDNLMHYDLINGALSGYSFFLHWSYPLHCVQRVKEFKVQSVEKLSEASHKTKVEKRAFCKTIKMIKKQIKKWAPT